MRGSGLSFGYTVANLSPPDLSQCVFCRKPHWSCWTKKRMGYGDPRFGSELQFSNILDVQPWASYENFLSLSFKGKILSCLLIRHYLISKIPGISTPMRTNPCPFQDGRGSIELLILDGVLFDTTSRSHGHGNALAPSCLLDSVKNSTIIKAQCSSLLLRGWPFRCGR